MYLYDAIKSIYFKHSTKEHLLKTTNKLKSI